MTDFTPWASLAGGALIGLSAALLMLTLGRIAGIIGIAAGALPPWRGPVARERLAFVAGLVAAPALWLVATGAMPVVALTDDPWLLVGAGLLVGFGAMLGSGCTSGHGVCGLARLAPRSVVSVAVFMAVAAGVVAVMR